MDLSKMNIKHLDSTPTDSGIKSSMTLEATVDVKPQELRKLRGFYTMTQGIPGNLPAEAQIVLQAIFSCFERQNKVAEGVLKDLYWGFGECGIPPQLTYNGLKQLEAEHFVKFQTPDNILSDDPHPDFWIRYEPKLLELAYEGSTSL